jgi:hypothetical protein
VRPGKLEILDIVALRCALFHAVRPMSGGAVGPTNRRPRHINSERVARRVVVHRPRHSDCCRLPAQTRSKTRRLMHYCGETRPPPRLIIGASARPPGVCTIRRKLPVTVPNSSRARDFPWRYVSAPR